MQVDRRGIWLELGQYNVNAAHIAIGQAIFWFDLLAPNTTELRRLTTELRRLQARLTAAANKLLTVTAKSNRKPVHARRKSRKQKPLAALEK